MHPIIRKSLLLAGLASAATGAFAAGSADLKITGTIKPAACDVTLSGGAVLDFGDIPANTLKDTAFTNLGNKSVDVSVICGAPTKVALAATDGRSGSNVPGIGAFLFSNQSDASTYGVGEVDGKKVGAYVLYSDTAPVVDAAAGARLASDNGGTTWAASASASNAMTPTRWHGFGDAGSLVPGQYKTIRQTYKVQLGLNKKADLPPLTKDVPINGLATFTIKYL